MIEDADSQRGRIVEIRQVAQREGSAGDRVDSHDGRKPTVAIVDPEVQRESGR